MTTDTQHEAWDALQETLGEKQRAVYETLLKNPAGLTGYELALRIGKPHNWISGRISELVNGGLAIDSGLRRRSNASGKNQVVWVALKEPQRPVPEVKRPFVITKEILQQLVAGKEVNIGQASYISMDIWAAEETAQLGLFR